MNFVGYLVTMANLQNFGSGPLRDMSVRVADVGTLANEFKAFPQLNIEGFKETGFYRVGDIGIYMSTNTVSYLTNGSGNPRDEGLLIIFYYDKAPAKPTSKGNDDGTMAYIHSGEFTEGVKEYLESQESSGRPKRSIGTSSTELHKTNFSEELKKYLDTLNIFGRSQGYTSDFTQQVQAKQNLLNEKENLAKIFNKVFDESNIYGRTKHSLDTGTNSANGNNLKDLKNYLNNLKN